MMIMIALVAIATAFVSCKKPDSNGNNVIEAKNVENSSSQIATVKAVLFDDVNDEEVYLASCKYEKNGFKITLPKTLSENYLQSGGDYYPEWITISDKNAKVGYFELLAYDKTGDEIGHFYLERKTINEFQDGEAAYFYSDRNFTMKGTDEITEEDEENGISYTYSEEYNCSLKKGYNIIYITYDVEYNMPNIKVKILLTTQKPSGTNWVWKFETWGTEKKSPAHSFKSIKDVKKNFLHK